MDPLRRQFIEFALDSGVLKFGQFVTKAGRRSPYFFNAGLFNRGTTLARLARFYGQTLLTAERQGRVRFDMLFGPAYKGITLAAATAIALAELGRDVDFAYNRKEAKDHGEGGILVGAPLAGRVVIVDDVISAGTSVAESVALIRQAGATPAAVLVALDRCERAGCDTALSEYSAAQEVTRRYGIPVLAIADLDDLMAFVDSDAPQAAALRPHRDALLAYRARYGA
ncbi:MAG: orotate phosphoribosyltransferase [Sutterellaceae bacterium]|nr:orotate phosphoribosyltransferase [Burkholderiaceae bacterium]MCX7901548.1 orotate phosphoribosyltransferase [Burkholderiaceae bacterium]MDW8430146.1 orotate phosphoribosyltransferase [Sutterellaceae bacterium]